MNITIVTACPGGRTTSWLAGERLARAAERQGHTPVFDAEDSGASDLVIVAASTRVDLSRYAGQALYRADMADALADPDHVIEVAREAARPYDPADEPAPPTTAAEQAPAERVHIVGVTACPTGVAHTFMAAPALTEAGRRQWGTQPGAHRNAGLGRRTGCAHRRGNRGGRCRAAGLPHPGG